MASAGPPGTDGPSAHAPRGEADRPGPEAYPPGVPPSYRMPDVALGRFLEDAVRDFPARPALVAGPLTLDHTSVLDAVLSLARGLAAVGIERGDRVVVALPNLATTPLVLFAVWRLGAIAVPVDPGGSPERLRVVVDDARAQAILAPRRLVAVLGDRAPADRAPDGPDGPDAPNATLVLTVDDDAWLRGRHGDAGSDGSRATAWLRRVRPRRPRTSSVVHVSELGRLVDAAVEAPAVDLPPGPSAGDVALLVYPSDGAPVAAVHTHANLVAGAFQARLWVPDIHAGTELLLLTEGLHDPWTLTVGLLVGVLSAATVALEDGPTHEALARAVERHRPTLLPTTGARLAGLTGSGDGAKRDVTSLRVVLARSGVDAQVAADVERLTGGARVRETFGIGGAAPFTHAQPVYGRVVPGAIGLPVTSTEMLVADLDADPDLDLDPDRATDDRATDDRAPAVPAPAGVPGRLVVRGPQVATAVWGEDGPRRVDRDGWVVSGEVVVTDPDGIVRSVGRADELVRFGTGVLAPRRLEEAIERHPGVDRAGVSVVDGHLVAEVVLRRRRRPRDQELLAHCREVLAPDEQPHAVHATDALPETPAGDLDRVALRARALDILAGGREAATTGTEVDEP